jgi:phosphinothricin acetyltransferase
MTITISPFMIEAYDEVLTLWQQCEGIGLSNADSREKIRSYLERNPGMSFLAQTQGRLIGAVLAGHDGRRGYIYHLAVHPEWRRQGLGRQLVDQCLQALKIADIQKCHLFIFNDNTGGINFWESFGWEIRKNINIISRKFEADIEGAVFNLSPVSAEVLSNQHHALRKMTVEDWPAVLSIFKEGIATKNATFETEAPTWEKWDSDHLKECRLVAVDSGKVIGWAALSPVSSRCVYGGVAEVSLYIMESERGRGVGKQLLQALINESEQNGIWTLQAGIFPENESSIAVHWRCGFRFVGRREKLGQMDGQWRDVLLFERRSTIVV